MMERSESFLVPIGMYCRTAFQIREYLKKYGYREYPYPFDWSVTTFSSLEAILEPLFDPADVLRPENVLCEENNFVWDAKTKLIHFHDFLPETVKAFKEEGNINMNGMPETLLESELMINATERFKHTYGNLLRLKREKCKLGFVRQVHTGRLLNSKLPVSLEQENPEKMYAVIEKFLGHRHFSILLIESKTVGADALMEKRIVDWEEKPYGIFATILEREGYDGDGTSNFRGDTLSWEAALDRFVDQMEIGR